MWPILSVQLIFIFIRTGIEEIHFLFIISEISLILMQI